MAKIKSFQDYLNYTNGDIPEKKGIGAFFTTKVKAIIAGVLIVTGLGTFVACKSSKKTTNTEDTNKSTASVDLEDISLNELGVELPFTTDKKEYGATTNGKADPNKVVTDPNTGKIYLDKDSYNKKNEVGKVEIDTKNDTLEVKKDKDGKDKVYEKEDSIVIKDKEGNIKETDKTDSNTKYAPDGTPIPDGYAWDEGRKEIVPEKEVGKYVYDENGDLVSKETYKETPKTPTDKDAIVEEKTEEVIIPVEKTETTKKEETKEEPKKEETKEETKKEINKVVEEEVVEESVEEVVEEIVKPAEGVTNKNGTYTVNGLTFESKADYQQWIIQGFSGYAVDVDGIMKSEEALTNSKALVK